MTTKRGPAIMSIVQINLSQPLQASDPNPNSLEKVSKNHTARRNGPGVFYSYVQQQNRHAIGACLVSCMEDTSCIIGRDVDYVNVM